MLQINALRLPSKLPHPKAIKSFNDNNHSYEPEFWEFQYELYRYLRGAEDAVIISRYKSIVRNMNSIINPDRHVIPIHSFLSSWYWYRKEHQTRLEFHTRNLRLPVDPPDIDPERLPSAAPARPHHPNTGNVLFRYGKEEYMRPFLEQGEIRVAASPYYNKLEGDLARLDEESAKHSYLSGHYTKITTTDGHEIKLVGDICKTISLPNYFLLCMSTGWNRELFDDFSSDSCVIINNSEIFTQRLERVSSNVLNGWCFHHCPVHYFDPYERLKNEQIDAGMCKDFCFAYQREYRYIWFHLSGIHEASGFEFIKIGSIQDIADIHFR